MKARVDKDICIGCGLCESTCSEIFTIEDDGLAVAIEGDILESLVEQAEEAKDGCPVSAIEIDEE
ncbi:ferredoxin [Niameybacter massiliensis]|uniref:Ferredoxin n=1 Tax=Holtiella tumoricola TaxID=3018743 RepID=A0AA42DLQ2_9FIRM|nr:MULTISPECIES: ferredoxin [Lachnospirales]MDA3731184.1 ferredoxin [Holtiella tumoricola]